MIYWLFNRSLDTSIEWLHKKFKRKPELAEANIKVMKAGYNFCDITQMFQVRYEVDAAQLPAGVYRNIMGNEATTLGLVAASRRSGLPIFLGSYPITPASDILHELSRYKHYGATTFQAEDEIAAVCCLDRRRVRRCARHDDDERPGPRAQVREAINLAA